MDLDDVTMRAPSAPDVPRIAALVADGFDTFRSFAPAGWTPPPLEVHEGYLTARLWEPDTWATVADAGDRLAGIVSLIPASAARFPVADPQLAHLWQLFIARQWWGSGLATRLHALVTEAASRRGFTAMRLFTPADQTRARRFYEREGWRLAAGPQDDELGFPIVEYRLDLA